MTKGVVAVRFLGLFFSASVQGRTSEARCIVLTAISKQSLISLVRHM